jgi:hypothetical protein
MAISPSTTLTRPSQWPNPSPWALSLGTSTNNTSETESNAPYKYTHSRPHYQITPSLQPLDLQSRGGGGIMEEGIMIDSIKKLLSPNEIKQAINVHPLIKENK